MEEKVVTNEAKTSYYDSQIQSVEIEILTLKNKLSRSQIRLNDLKKQRNFHSGSIQKRITELFVRGQ
jgi:predicted transcriptional regulator